MREHRKLLLTVVSVVAAAACGCGNPSPQRDLQPPPVRQSSALLGHWAQSRIGNCINDEAWLSFEAPDVLTVTSVDRNFCYPHSVAASKGTFTELGNGLVELAWTTPEGDAHSERMTVAVRDDAAVFATAPVPEGYVVGDRGLNVSALARVQQTNTFRREDAQDFDQDGKSYRLTMKARVTLDVDPATVTLPAACTMKVDLSADAAWGDEPPEQGTETFELPCHITVADGRITVAADGFDPMNVHSTWSDYFEAQGAWGRHSGFVGNALFEFFRPILRVDRAHPDTLIQGQGGASWYAEMKTPPPETID